MLFRIQCKYAGPVFAYKLKADDQDHFNIEWELYLKICDEY